MERRRLFSTSDWSVSRSASVTSSAASSVQPPAKTDSERNSRFSSAERRSYDQSIVARRVCWRGSASRPPLSRSRRDESRSRISAGRRAWTRAAASSTASGMLSSRPQNSVIGRSGRVCERSHSSSTASGLGEGSTAYSTSPLIRSNSLLVTSSVRFGQALDERAELGCHVNHLLKVVEEQQQLSPCNCSARPS